MKAREVFGTLQWGSRGKPRRHPLTAAILALTMIVPVGCTGSGTGGNFVRMSTHDIWPNAPKEVVPAPPTEAIHLKSGKVAVTSGRFDPKFDIEGGPVAVVSGRFAPEFEIVDGSKKGGVRGAAKGAVEGVSESLKLLGLVLSVPGGIFLAPIPIVLMPVALVGGAIEGAIPTRAVKAEERDLAQMVADPKIQDDLRDRVVALSLTKTPYTLRGLADQGPGAPGEQPDYRPLSRKGIHVVLELVLERVVLQRSGSWDADYRYLEMVVVVSWRLVHAVDNREIRTKSLTFSQLRPLSHWTDNPERVRDSLNEAHADIAEKTVQELFLRPESN
ncbi:MAG: hypothetical protein K8F29_02080 [Kofleriaceae bacterium]|nr:hypothetical protein [Candidatus Methylomirabilis lanthanidiphila]